MSLEKFGIYYIRNRITGHVYVGSTTRTFASRKTDHWTKLRLGVHKSSRLTRAWKKYGQDAFEFVIVEILSDPEEVLAREQYYLDLHFGPACYNARRNAESNRGWRASAETRARMSAAVKRRRPMSEETKKKLSKATMGMVRNPWTPESRAKLALAKTGKKRPERVRKALSERNKRLWADPEFCSRGVKHLDDARVKAIAAMEKTFTGSFISPSGAEFHGVVNLTAFCRQHGLNIPSMSMVSRGLKRSYKGWTYRAEAV